MPAGTAAVPFRPFSYRRILLAGASLLALVAGGGAAEAGQLRSAVAQAASAATAAASAAQTQAASAAALANASSANLIKASALMRANLIAQAAAAANAAVAAGVTDGQSPGGLITDPRVGFNANGVSTTPSLWANIGKPVETVDNGQYTETLTQNSDRAIATWQQFNVGKNTTVHFDQSAGNTSNGNGWVVLNRIDATGTPSQIRGQIKAEGTVLLINPNGIVFGAGSQVNVHTLVAAAMDINSYTGTNYGVFQSGNGSYTQISAGGVPQTTGNGAAILAPVNESGGNQAFLDNGLYANTAFTDITGATFPTAVFSIGTGAGTNSGITVEKGAAISTVSNVSGFDNGGYVALLGPNVTNAGVIGTAAGQIILAAGTSVFLSEPAAGSTGTAFAVNTLNPSTSSSLIYAPTLAVAGGALAINAAEGILTADRGNITLIGDEVRQLGFVETTTSITRAGSITITAIGGTTPLAPNGGNVIFGPGSATAIAIDENGESIPGSSVATGFTAPTIGIATTNLDMQPGALIVAPGATMTVNRYQPPAGGGADPVGRVLLETGSTIDLAGLAATAAVSDYLYTFKVTANDVADSPLAQSLIGQTVTIDLRLSGTRADGETWVGSPLFASTGAGYLGNIPQSISQLLTKGGKLQIGASAAFQDVLAVAGSLVDLSGGIVTFTGGTVSTTKLLGTNGRLYNIGSADPFIAYAGLAGTFMAGHSRWGVVETFSSPLIAKGYDDPGYIDGISAGSIGISAVNAVLEGIIDGNTVISAHQRALAETAATQTTPDVLPLGAALSITLQSPNPSSNAPADAVVLDSTAADVLGADFTLASPLILANGTLTYSTDRLSAENFGAITIGGASGLSMAAGAGLSVRTGGSIALSGVTSLDGTLTARSGTIAVTGFVPPSNTWSPPSDAPLTIGPHARLDVSGLWINDTGRTGANLRGRAFIDGGSITIATDMVDKSSSNSGTTVTAIDGTQSIVVVAGSVFDLSSGGYVGTDGMLKVGAGGLPAGNGGNLSLLTYAPSSVISNWSNNQGVAAGTYQAGSNFYAPTTANGATVTFDGTVYAAGLNTGGIFTLQAPAIVVDGGASGITSSAAGADKGTVTLPASFFTSGFSTYDLISTYGGVTVTAGTTLVLQQKNYRIAPSTPLPASGASLRDFTSLGYAPDGARQPVDLNLVQQAFEYGAANDPSSSAGIAIGGGASIVADPQAAVTLTANGSITVLGSIVAPAGSITLINQDSSLAESGKILNAGRYLAAQDIWIGANALLDVSGVFVPDPTVVAYSIGSALDAGSITLASAGAIVALQGATFDLEGTSAVVQQPGTSTRLRGSAIVDRTVWSDGGTLTLYSSTGAVNSGNGWVHGLYFAGTIHAAGGTAGASGGTLNIGQVIPSTDNNGDVSYTLAGYGSIIVAQNGDDSAAFAGSNAPITAAQLSTLMSAVTLKTTSTTSNSIASSGTKTFTIPTGFPNGILSGNTVTISDGAGDTISGTIASYNASTGALSINVTGSTGAGTHNTWNIGVVNSSAFITADTINTANSGLDSVSLTGSVAFSGNVTLRVPDALYLNGNVTLLPAGITPSSALSAYAATSTAGGANTIGAPMVALDAGYIRWLSGTVVAPTLADGTLTLNAAAQIDLGGVPSVSNATAVVLSSGGDIRFLNSNDPDVAPYLAAGLYRGAGSIDVSNGYASANSLTSNGSGGLPSAGALLVADDLTMTAREIYPATDSAFLLMSLGLAPDTALGTHNTIAFVSSGATPNAPLSAGGAILVDAKSIVQGGVLYAPLGTIQLGYGADQTLPAIFLGDSADTGSNPYDPVHGVSSGLLTNILSSLVSVVGATRTVTTTNVTLASGSLTMTSAAGLAIPYGTTTDGTNWTDGGIVLNGPPTKLIVLGGASVVTQSGAVVDESGGGDVYATEFVPGTGGSRNVLAAGTQTVYALVPSFEAKVAAYDPTFAASVGAGAAVRLDGGDGIAGGTYVLLPAQYATLPGAFRVAVIKTDTGVVGSFNSVVADGSVYMTGTLANAVTGAKSSQTALLQIQSNTTWTRYSEIDIASGNRYFAALAATNGTTLPRLPIDAGQLVIDAGSALSLRARNDFTAVDGGRGGMVDITGNRVLILAADRAPPTNSAGYLVLDADQISDLGVESVLIGGTRSTTNDGVLISASASDVLVETDAAHGLSGPELLLSTRAGGSGIVIGVGSVIKAEGRVSPASADTLVIGIAGSVSGDGSLLRVSAGDVVAVVRRNLPSITAGNLTVGDGTMISGNALTLDSSGAARLSDSAVLLARNYDFGANVINIGGGASGLVLTDAVIANFAGADSVSLRSASVFNFYDGIAFGSNAAPIGRLTFDGAGFHSDGGSATITAGNIVLENSRSVTVANAGGGTGGSLALNAADTITFGDGTFLFGTSQAVAGFSSIAANAGREILFTGSGAFDAPAAAVTLTSPLLMADVGSRQTLNTNIVTIVNPGPSQTEQTTAAGALVIQQGFGTAPILSPGAIGGSLTLTAGSISDAGTIIAQAGTVKMEATGGDLVLTGNAAISAAGSRITLFALTEDTPGGTIKLIADAGNVTVGDTTTLDVSAVGNGYAGTLAIQANGTATLGGTLKGGAAYNDLGGTFVLAAGSMAGNLPLSSGFTGSFSVELGQGDIVVASGQSLTSGNVLLVANNGSIDVEGMIDASGPSGGTIALYGRGTSTLAAGTAGANGVTVGSGAKLFARYRADLVTDPAYASGESTLVERGGTITLGTTGTPDGTLNATYGYENVPTSGAITVAAGAIFDVSGGPGDTTGNIDTTGGSVIVRAPILTSNNINVRFQGTVVTNADANGNPSGKGVVADTYAVWSTTDNGGIAGTSHFDSIIDPAGWYDKDGNLLPGIFKDANGNIVLNYTGANATASQLAALLAADYFAPNMANANHQTFYGFVNDDTAQATPGTLMRFVQNPFNGQDSAVQADFAGAQIQVGSAASVSLSSSSKLALQPEIDLVNPSTNINGGNITVDTNWNLGTGTTDANGALILLYRHNGEAPILSLRAVENVNIKASITDGFFQNTPMVGTSWQIPVGSVDLLTAQSSFNTVTAFDLASVDTGGLVLDPTSAVVTFAMPGVLGITGSDPFDGYYSFYEQYLQEYTNFWLNLSGNSGFFGTIAVGGTGAPTSVTSLLTTAQALYNPQDIHTYGAYLAAYDTYQLAYSNWSFSVSTVGTLPVAPSAPPAQSIPVMLTFATPTNNSPAPVTTATDKSPIAAMNLASETSSSSYRFVAGALTGSVDPLVVNSARQGDVTVDGHVSYPNTAIGTTGQTIDIPTIVRTGTGTIDIAAAGNVELRDATAPGVIYTAGTIAANAAGFTPPAGPTATTPNGLTGAPVWATGGGAVTISAGLDIIGIETPRDGDGSQTGAAGVSTGQFWSPWYYTAGHATGTSTPFDTTSGGIQYSSWINYPTFFQGLGALGGGNVTLTAGRNIDDISVSLPETIQVGGGQTAGGAAATAHYYGGGDLLVKAGGNLYSGTFYVGRGTGRIEVGGVVAADPANPITGLATTIAPNVFSSSVLSGVNTAQSTAVPLLLAAQDGFITVQALGSITLGGIFEPTRVPADVSKIDSGTLPPGFGVGFDSYGANGGVALTSLAGDVTVDTLMPSQAVGSGITNALFTRNGATGGGTFGLTPATFEVEAISGDITIANSLFLVPSVSGTLSFAAGGSISTVSLNAGNPITFAVTMLDDITASTTAASIPLLDIQGVPTPTTLASALHADDPNPAILYAGLDISGNFSLIKPAEVEAGRDIVNTIFTGQNNSATDITSIIAGRDILAKVGFDANGNVFNHVSTFTLYGPGDFLVEAGRNLGPFLTKTKNADGTVLAVGGGGVFSVGDGSNCAAAVCGNPAVKSYLPVEGANITALFGVGNGIDTAAAINDYVLTSSGGIGFLSSITRQLEVTLDTLAKEGTSSQSAVTQLEGLLAAWGLSPLPANALTSAGLIGPAYKAHFDLAGASLGIFQAKLSAGQQDLLVDRAFLDFLTQVGLDYNDATSPYHQQYARAYTAISTLFPASLGYTNNNTGGSNGASATVHTGDLRMAHSLIETQTGGDIAILGPGGNAYVGSNSADMLAPNQQGILTLQGGTISGYTDGSVQVYQSRVFTEQGGDVDLFSANGDLNAGKGKKSAAAYPPLKLVCDSDGYCRVSPAGLITGAGIGALLSVPGQDPTKSNANLVTPHGTVDAGAAGIRAAGNLNIVALHVLNAFNIDVGGKATGVPVAASPNLGALTAASDTAGAAANAADTASRNSRQTGPRNTDLPSIITIEVIGYGGVANDTDDAAKRREDERRRGRDRQSRYDAADPVRVVGYGPLNTAEIPGLTEEERRKLSQP